MMLSAYSSVNKFLLLLCLLFGSVAVVAQKPKGPPSGYNSFLDTQWWLGLKFGRNYTNPSVIQSNSVFTPIDYDLSNLDKTYGRFDQGGGHAGMELSFYVKGISLAFQPTFKVMKYGYTNNFEWTGISTADRLEAELEVNQSLQVLELPVLVKLEILRRGKIRPFIMGGWQYAVLLDASRLAKITYTDYLADTPQIYSGGSFSIGAVDAFRSFHGSVLGGGAALDYLNIRTILECTYSKGFRSINNSNYDENQLVALGDVSDEIKLNNLSFSISLVFPLKYIDKTFQPY